MPARRESDWDGPRKVLDATRIAALRRTGLVLARRSSEARGIGAFNSTGSLYVRVKTSWRRLAQVIALQRPIEVVSSIEFVVSVELVDVSVKRVGA